MTDLSVPALRDLVVADGCGLRIRCTIVMIDEDCERFAVTRLAALQDELLLARHCAAAEVAAVERLRAEATALRESLDASVRVVDARIDASPPGLSRASQRVAVLSAERASASVLSALRALLDSESVVRSGHGRSSLRVSDGSARTAQRVDTVLSEMDRVVSDHRAVVSWLQHEQRDTNRRAARRLHRRAEATATIDTLILRTQARRQVA